MTEPLAPVTLRAEVEINGQTYAYQQSMPRPEWEAIERDPQLHTTVKNMLLARLGAAVMDRLQPPVTVHMPTKMDEAVTQRAAEELEGN
ncbi:hypothetical protein ACIP6Q_39160 [Streptomyces bobili]|uniref:hypothetical protein n=1 Tax=Streptomyces bobili TaxID=67280 RepID=UPI00381CCFCB